MRLNQHDIDVIKAAAADIFGKEAVVRLFGSRVDDAANAANAGNLIPAADVEAKFAAKRLATRRRLENKKEKASSR
ncbi:hypothetical protein [Halomonas tibetensis]|uniref:Uncharacterized protein n=1 Tax=Halomonas tibetensis TaxID=2259590 RepID=A0ABV7B4P3_9GAMM